ncbi:MAG: hypothetical protein ACPIOQ_21505 [Promethearchaeia archaeon]
MFREHVVHALTLCPHFKPPGWDNRSGVIAGAAAPKTVKKTNPRKPTSPQGDTLLESERAGDRYVLDPSKPLTERQQLKLLGVTDITGQDQGPKCKDDNDRILLNVRLMSGSDESGGVRFRVSTKSKLKKLMRSYSEYMGSKPLTELQQIKLLGVTDTTESDRERKYNRHCKRKLKLCSILIEMGDWS